MGLSTDDFIWDLFRFNRYDEIKAISSVQLSYSVRSNSLRPHGLQHARSPRPSPTPRVYSNSCPLSQWCHPTISSSVVPFSSCLQSFPASGSFQMSQFFASGGQSIGVSALASVLPMNIQDWFPLGWTGWISLQSKGLSRIFCLNCCKFFPLPNNGDFDNYVTPTFQLCNYALIILFHSDVTIPYKVIFAY